MLSFIFPLRSPQASIVKRDSPPRAESKADKKTIEFIASFRALKVDCLSQSSEFQALVRSEEPSEKKLYAQIIHFLEENKGKLEESKEVFFISQQLKVLSPKILVYFPNVEKLTLIFTAVRFLPKEMDTLTHLKELQIIHSAFDKVTSLCHLKGLEYLRLNRIRIKVLPDKIGDLDNLRTFLCCGNGLIDLPDDFAKLQRLEELNLDDNSFKAVPPVVYKLPRLRKIHLQDNPLAYLPEGGDQIDPRSTTGVIMHGFRWIQIPGSERRTLLVHSFYR